MCLPSAFHADAVVEALEAGVDVIVEEPIDVTLDAAEIGSRRPRAPQDASRSSAGASNRSPRSSAGR
ncbi:hypothetical protein ACU8V6_00375 [Vibrio alginolyticus]